MGSGIDFKSSLSFKDVRWPTDLSAIERSAMGLALNLSGSFEGHEGWQNISNNFDDMGLSLGLLNQNLGSGSLQPLLVEIARSSPATLSRHLEKARLQSLLQMLADWQRATGPTLEKLSFSSTQELPLSPLDTEWLSPGSPSGLPTMKAMASTSANGHSVQWAIQSLHVGSQLESRWQSELQSLASDPAYVTLQVGAARKIHDKTFRYLTHFSWKSLRAYLFLFDIVVQNGGLYDDDLTEFENWSQTQGMSANPEGEKKQMLKVLELRLRHVRSQFKNDVALRKKSIIYGQGIVHGANRNYAEEYDASLDLIIREF